MKRNEQSILVGFVVIGLLIAFWLLVLSPKRNQAADLQQQVDDLNASLATAQQEVTASQQSRKSFGIDYRRLVVLGKAVPADSDQASLLVQLQRLADRSGVRFQSMDLGDSSGASTTAAAPTTSTSTTPTTTDSASTSTDPSASASTSSGTVPTTSPVATEASAATLPLGASVGPAGLPVMPYALTFSGGFFEIADFLQSVDGMVHMRQGLVDVQGRLLTVDGFTLTPIQSDSTNPVSTPMLTAELQVTSFVAPADQGVTAGATPTGPAVATPAPVASTTDPSTATSSTPTAVAAPTTSPSP